MYQRNCIALVLCACLFLSSATVVGAKDVLSVIPDNALGFVVVKRVGEADAKVSDLAKLVGVRAPSVLTLVKKELGVNKGLNRMGSLAMVALAPEDVQPVPVPLLFVPTTDYQTFIKPLDPKDVTDGVSKVLFAGSPSVVGQKGGYAVLTLEKHSDRLRSVLKSTKSVAKNVAPLKSFLADGDIYVVATSGGIRLGAEQGLNGLASARAGLEQAGEDAEAVLAGLSVYEAMFKVLKEKVTHFGLSIRVADNLDVHVSSRLLYKSDAGASKPQELGTVTLSGLPAGPYVMAFAGVVPNEYSEAMMKFSAEMSAAFAGGAELTKEQISELSRLSADSMKGLRGMSMVMGVGKPGSPLYSNMVTVMTVDDVESYLENYVEVLSAMRKFGQKMKIPFYDFEEPEKIKVGGVEGFKFSMKMPGLGDADNPGAREMMKKMFGGEKMTVYLAPADERTIVGAYVSKDSLKRAIKAVKNKKSSLASDAGIAKTAALLPRDSHWVAFLSPKGAIDFGKSMAATFAPDGAAVEIPDFPETPPIGFAARFSKSKIDSNIVVPAPVLQAIGVYVQKVKGEEVE